MLSRLIHALIKPLRHQKNLQTLLKIGLRWVICERWSWSPDFYRTANKKLFLRHGNLWLCDDNKQSVSNLPNIPFCLSWLKSAIGFFTTDWGSRTKPWEGSWWQTSALKTSFPELIYSLIQKTLLPSQYVVFLGRFSWQSHLYVSAGLVRLCGGNSVSFTSQTEITEVCKVDTTRILQYFSWPS